MAQRTTPSQAGTGRTATAAVEAERPDALWEMELRLRKRGFSAVAGADEAGRGACAARWSPPRACCRRAGVAASPGWRTPSC